MLTRLYIRNFTIIDEQTIDFRPGFSVITGETGAGKSIVIGAIGLLLGNRADIRQVKEGANRCTIEGTFSLGHDKTGAMRQFFDDNDLDYSPEETVLRREVNQNGKSRAFINDTPVSLVTLRELGDHLIDIHSQHQNLLLGKEDFQLNVIDLLADDARELADYQAAFRQYADEEQKYKSLGEELSRTAAEADFLRFQQKELSEARLNADEQEELEQRVETMRHAEEIKSALYQAHTTLDGDEGDVHSLLRRVQDALESIAAVFPAAQTLAERTDSSMIELMDVANEIASAVDNIDYDPAELQMATDRLDLINTLQHKYHADSNQTLIDLLYDISRRLDNIDSGEERLEEQRQRVEAARKQCTDLAAKLSAKRRKAAAHIEKELQQRLAPLGIPNVQFRIDLSPTPLSRQGADKAVFLFSANAGQPLQPVSQVASGGEIARVMLSIKAMTGNAVELPTIIFDEIDTGVSGRVAEQMAHIMREMGSHERQVISITHLPQIAALGSTHYKVSKTDTAEGTTSQMRMLTDDERVAELAQMLSGSEVTAAAIDNAKELLRKAAQQ